MEYISFIRLTSVEGNESCTRHACQVTMYVNYEEVTFLIYFSTFGYTASLGPFRVARTWQWHWPCSTKFCRRCNNDRCKNVNNNCLVIAWQRRNKVRSPHWELMPIVLFFLTRCGASETHPFHNGQTHISKSRHSGTAVYGRTSVSAGDDRRKTFLSCHTKEARRSWCDECSFSREPASEAAVERCQYYGPCAV